MLPTSLQLTHEQQRFQSVELPSSFLAKSAGDRRFLPLILFWVLTELTIIMGKFVASLLFLGLILRFTDALNGKWNILEEDLFGYCEAWRFGVETNTVRNWETLPAECKSYVQDYMLNQYLKDLEIVANQSIAYADGLQLSPDGNDAWVFDIDETLLTNLPYYATVGFGAEVFNKTLFNEWVDQASAPPVITSRRLYFHLLNLGFKIVLLTGRDEPQRDSTARNLASAGYHSWEILLLRDEDDQGKPATIYKSERRSKVEQTGLRIRGNSGDQWSDLNGYSTGDRTFKLPNPMYYIP